MTIKIYVGNLSYTMTESQLNDLFVPYGEVESAKIITDRYSGNPRGFAFVEMTRRNEGQKAIEELNGKEIQGRSLKVTEARARRDKGPHAGSRSSRGNRDTGFRRGPGRGNY
jgi:RNA recognition motif-containing protein